MYTHTQRCTGCKQDHQFSQGQYECILTPRAALATNRTISSHRGQYEWILTPSAALATTRTISSHRGQYECILTPRAALAANRTISSHRGEQYEWILTPSAALAANRTISSHRGAVRVYTHTQRCTGHKQDHQFSQGSSMSGYSHPYCTGHKQDHQFSQGQYEWILTPSSALAANRTISSHRGSMSVY